MRNRACIAVNEPAASVSGESRGRAGAVAGQRAPGRTARRSAATPPVTRFARSRRLTGAGACSSRTRTLRSTPRTCSTGWWRAPPLPRPSWARWARRRRRRTRSWAARRASWRLEQRRRWRWGGSRGGQAGGEWARGAGAAKRPAGLQQPAWSWVLPCTRPLPAPCAGAARHGQLRMCPRAAGVPAAQEGAGAGAGDCARAPPGEPGLLCLPLGPRPRGPGAAGGRAGGLVPNSFIKCTL